MALWSASGNDAIVSENGYTAVLALSSALWLAANSAQPSGVVAVTVACTVDRPSEVLIVDADTGAHVPAVSVAFYSSDGATTSPSVVNVTVVGVADGDNGDGEQTAAVTCVGSAVSDGGTFTWVGASATVAVRNR